MNRGGHSGPASSSGLAAACDHMANHIQRYGGPDGYEPESNTALTLLEEVGVRGATERFASMHAVLMQRPTRCRADDAGVTRTVGLLRSARC